ncbi:5'-3' exonuclease [Serinibacter salmoneus]|uniref:5'-3' exonuclease n=1 Tax=Serinibacter salmoneus TaxID=556530 RepID=A0A2A9CXE7_9MICO|nr:5'-3' exonuclease [Serinibacter salmoneus]PFG18821.1 5'-3' exonuclease [Serinibacter salmoneus]
MSTPGSLLLLDSASMYFRAFYGVKGEVTSPRGEPVGAIRGFLDAVATLISSRRPDRVVACWDEDWRPAFRVEAISTYKAHRVAEGEGTEPGAAEEVPDALSAQVPVIVDLLAAVGIARVGAAGCEADDVIGTLATRAVAAGSREVEIVTGDRDLFQLVADPAPVTPVRVLYTGRGMRNLETVTTARLADKYGVADGAAYAAMATLRGDPSDGLPGVPGVGEKTAAGLLARYGTLEAVMEAARGEDAAMSPSVRAKLLGAQEYLAAAPRVVGVLRDADLPAHEDALPAVPADPDRLAALAERWGVGSAVARLTAAMAAATGSREGSAGSALNPREG